MNQSIKIDDYYLDLDSIGSLSNVKYTHVISLYESMLNNHSVDNIGCWTSIFHTLSKSGYLKNIIEEEREEKIKTITDNEI